MTLQSGRRGAWSHPPLFCVASALMALGWLWCYTPSLSHTIFYTPLCHTPSFTHHTLLQDSFTHHLCHTTSFTNYLSHTALSPTIFDTPSFTHNFVTHHLSHTTLSHTIFHTPSVTPTFHTPLCHTQLCHTPLCHTPSFTHDSVTQHL